MLHTLYRFIRPLGLRTKAELALAKPISLGAAFRAKQASPLLKDELEAPSVSCYFQPFSGSTQAGSS